MRLANGRSEFSVYSRCLAAPTCCPSCGDRLVAPELSEYVDGSEIRHHWVCEVCGEASSTSVPLVWH